MHPAIVLLIAVAAYAGWGIGLPLLLGASTPVLIAMNTTGAVFAAVIALARLISVLEASIRHQQLELTTDLRRVSGHEFELLVGELFRRAGWDVTETAQEGRPDGGVDLRLRRGGEQRLVQCKQWQAWRIGVEEVRKLAGTLLREGLDGRAGVLVTSSSFTSTAIDEAKRLGMCLIDGRDLLGRLEQVGAVGLVQQTSAVGAAWACPKCSTPMILALSTHGWWLRCPRYTAGCQGKHDLGPDPRRAVEALLAGDSH